jgi:hypothetical protein
MEAEVPGMNEQQPRTRPTGGQRDPHECCVPQRRHHLEESCAAPLPRCGEYEVVQRLRGQSRV